MVCGVYKILNTKTGKFYIGSSKDINKRFKDHIRKLKNCVHHSAKLQNSCNKHGVSSLELHIIEVCSLDRLLEREQYWIDYHNSYREGYNSSAISNRPSSNVASSFKEKNKKHVDGIIDAVKCILSTNTNDSPYISVPYHVRIVENRKVYPIRVLKAVNLIKNLSEDIQKLPKDSEYKITNFNYIGKSGGYYLKEVPEPYNDIHNKLKTQDTISQFLKLLVYELSSNVKGKWILSEIENAGIELTGLDGDLKIYSNAY